jgi:tetratricopeptide (TPR) repeat protein
MIRNAVKIVFLGLGLFLCACHPMPRDMQQAAHDALENARVQLDSGNKTKAMRLFKEAEHFGLLADDTLTVAHARFNIAKCLGVYADEKEFISLLKAADEGFGDDYAERAKVMTVLGDYYQFHRQFDSAEFYLNRAMDYAERSGSIDAKRWVLSAFHVKCFNAKEYKKSGDYIQQFFQTYPPNASDSVLMYYYHNLGNVYFEMGNMDSMAYCYGKLEELVTQSEPDCSAQNEDGWYYGALANFAEMRGDFEKACEYIYWYEKRNAHYEIEEHKNNLALISQKYDTEMMQNELNQKIIRKQRVIILISGLAALVLLAFLISQIRLARNRKREAEINAELFHFKQQNQVLAQKGAEHEQIQQDYADRLSEALDKEHQTMMLLDIYLNNSKKANLLNDLERSVFGKKDHWKAMLAVVEEKYPGLWETLGQKYPDLDEEEKKSFILSHFKVSRQEEADYLGTTVNMVDKLRGRVRKKMERHE